MSFVQRGRRRLEDETGAATVEFAVLLAPLLITLMWSILLSDLVGVKLKALEMARYLTWESTVYRDPQAVVDEVNQRFANLNSTNLEAAENNVYLGLDEITIEPKLDDQLEVKMTGQVPQGNLPFDLNGALGGMSNGVNAVMGWMKLPKIGKARSEVKITVKNKIVTSLRLINTEIQGAESDGIANGFEFNEHYALVYDTWKAWPNKNRMVGRRDGSTADPMQTYPIAEKLVADQVGEIAYGKFIPVVGDIIGVVQQIGEFMSFFGLPPLMADSRSTEDSGPVTMRPVDTVNVASFSPSHGTNDATRWGHRYRNSTFNADNPQVSGIDRSHYSLPYRPTGGHWYRYDGGWDGRKRVYDLNRTQYENEYYKTYQCRGHYYEGMIVPDGKPGEYRDYDGCGDGVDKVQKQVGDILGGFGGFSLPSF